jgi:cytochrome b involved in lipid metabolism
MDFLFSAAKKIFGVDADVAHFSMAEIARHHSKDTLWIITGTSVYDITPLLNSHPGGKEALLRRGGGCKDCQPDFGFHSAKARSEWQTYYIGEVGAVTDDRGKALLRNKGFVPVEDLRPGDAAAKCASKGNQCMFHYIAPPSGSG